NIHKKGVITLTRGQPPNGWYTAGAARKTLGGISDGKLRTLIGTGDDKIERWTPPGTKQGFFKASDVHKIARKWKKEAIEKERSQREGQFRPPIKFRCMEIEEMPVVAEILHELFDVYPNIEQWQDRIRANPEIGYIVTDD